MIRPGTPNDAADMGRILSDWIDETPWMPRLHSRDEDRGFCRHLLASTEVVVCELHGQVAGFAARAGQILPALYLAPGARGQGNGRALLDRAKSASGGRLGLWTFQANAGAVRFYVREGFAEVERTEGAGNAEKLPDLRLEWRD